MTTYTYACDRGCGFTTDRLNAYLSHACCRTCGYVAVGLGFHDALADLHEHYRTAHPSPRVLIKVDGSGAGTCDVCRRGLDYSYTLTFSDGTYGTRCSLHITTVDEPPRVLAGQYAVDELPAGPFARHDAWARRRGADKPGFDFEGQRITPAGKTHC